MRFFPRALNQPCSGGTAKMVLVQPSGEVYREAYPVVVDTSGTDCGDKVDLREEPTPGTWTIRFEGSGQVQGWLDVTRE